MDEAAQATEPETLIPLTLQPSKVLLAGDPQQLSTTLTSMAASRAGFGRPLLSRLMVDCARPASLLTVQYRMDPQISQFPNGQFYGGALVDSEGVRARGPAPWSGDSWLGPCTFIDINGSGARSGANGGAESRDAGGSKLNRPEAEAVARIVARFHQHGLSLADSSQLRVITFYSAQVRTIRSALRASRMAGAGAVSVHTVDGSQGAEADVVVVSFVRSNPRGAIGFLSDAKRLNVALTRPRRSLVMVGDADTLSKAGGAVGALLASMRTRGLIFPGATTVTAK